jgi:hypothetical protein
MTEIRRTGEEAVQCMWFAMCDSTTDLEVNHPTLGWTPCCAGCATVVGIAVPPEIAGWRVRVHFLLGDSERTETSAFHSPIKATAEWHVLESAKRWHKTGTNFRAEVLHPVYRGRTDSDWGSGAWTKAFKS